MTIVFVRGTSGSGKSTLVREVMSGYSSKAENFVEGRRNPLTYTLSKPGSKPLEVLGSYTSPCGGCDTIKTLDQIFELIRAAHSEGKHAIAEGMLLASDVKRVIALSEETNDVLIVSLTTPIDQCCENVRKRRAARGNEKEFNEKNTRTRYAYEQRQIEKLIAANVDIRTLVYDDALEAIRCAFD